MTKNLEGKTAIVTGGASGIGLASVEMMLNAGATVVVVDNDEIALNQLHQKHGDMLIPETIDLLNTNSCAKFLPKLLKRVEKIDIFHANAGLYVGGDLVDAELDDIDRMMNLNVNVVMKNVRDILPHMIKNKRGDIIVTSSLAAHYPTPWEPVYAASKWAINCFVQTTRRQVYKHGIRMGSVSPGPVITSLVADWPEEKLAEAKAAGSFLEASEVAETIHFMLTRSRATTIRDVIIMPTNFDL